LTAARTWTIERICAPGRDRHGSSPPSRPIEANVLAYAAVGNLPAACDGTHRRAIQRPERGPTNRSCGRRGQPRWGLRETARDVAGVATNTRLVVDRRAGRLRPIHVSQGLTGEASTAAAHRPREYGGRFAVRRARLVAVSIAAIRQSSPVQVRQPWWRGVGYPRNCSTDVTISCGKFDFLPWHVARRRLPTCP
jgi:hypothetical protein